MNQKKYIISLDSGTTSCRALLIDESGNIVAIRQKEIRSYYPESGWVEQDALEIWNTQISTLQSLKNDLGIHSSQITAIGITNQRETLVVWNKETGLPIQRAIVWQDRRTYKLCQELKNQGLENTVKEKTGLTLDPYFTATKLSWILENNPEAKQKLESEQLRAGTIDSWLIWKLTGGEVFATDVTNASRTMLFNIRTLEWDEELLNIFKIPKGILPKVLPSNANFGNIMPSLLSKRTQARVPIHGVAGDQQAALFGQTCFSSGDVKNTYGTGCFTLVNTGKEAIKSRSGLLTTIAWQLKEDLQPTYALEGSVFVAGAALKWLRDQLHLVHSTPEIDFYSTSTTKTPKGLYVVNGFSGLGAPYWDPNARGAIFGLELGTSREQLLRAFLEGIGYQSEDLLSAMAKDLKQPLQKVAVDGGAARSDYLMSFQASISNLPIERPVSVETTALGAAYLAGLGVGYWKNMDELRKLRSIERVFESKFSQEEREEKLKGYRDAVRRTLSSF